MKFIRTLLSYLWPWPESPRATSMDCPIEPKIKPLIDVFNSCAHIQTIASCQGHGAFRSPYVYFATTPEMASELSKRVRDLCWHEDRMHFDWIIRGEFNHEHELVFSLRSPALDTISRQADARWWLDISRVKLDADLSNLQMALKPFLLEMRTTDKVEV